jgi:hypothetical protein
VAKIQTPTGFADDRDVEVDVEVAEIDDIGPAAE